MGRDDPTPPGSDRLPDPEACDLHESKEDLRLAAELLWFYGADQAASIAEDLARAIDQLEQRAEPKPTSPRKRREDR